MREQPSSQPHTLATLGILAAFIAAFFLVETADAQTNDHYQCYKAKQLKRVCQEDLTAKCKTDADCQTNCLQKFTSRNVSLLDQFGPASPEVKKPKSLCAPAEKNPQGPPPQDLALHYKRYQIKGGPSVKGMRVLARDQFGDHVIELIKEDSLLVPASKSDVAVGPPPPGSNHYLCYKAKNKKKICTDDLITKCKTDADCTQGGSCDLGFGKVPQGLTDQFGNSTVEIKKVKFFCTPAEKNDENGGNGPFNPVDHLVGYQLKGSGINTTVHTNDQFGAEALALSKQEILLVPALKNPTGEPPGEKDADADGHVGAIENCLGSDPDDPNSTPESVAIPESCEDEVDNDLDGLTDDDDPGCTPPSISPDVFPAAGLDVFESTLELDDYPLVTPFGTCLVDFMGRGPTCVQRGSPVDLGGGQRQFDTEIIAMQLSGTATILVGGTCTLPTGPLDVTLCEVIDQASTGKVTDTNPDPNSDFPADSFFDVFFEVETDLGTLPGGPPNGPAGDPVRVEISGVRIMPPYITPNNACLNPNSPNPNCYAVSGLPHQHCPEPPDFLDHFKVYEIDDQALSIPVLLRDQFADDPNMDIVARDKFANPVRKTVGGVVFEIFDPLAHLTWYRLADANAPLRAVDIANQFGEFTLLITDPTHLLVPTRKEQFCPPVKLDHFKCYDVLADPNEVTAVGVRLQDQFDDPNEEVVTVREPVKFCNPVDKNGEGIGNERDHLTCYRIEPNVSQDLLVNVGDQFDSDRDITVRENVYLCVPSLKREVEVDFFPDTRAEIEIGTPIGSATIQLAGPTTVLVHLGDLADTDGNGREQVPTEIISMSLTGSSPLVGPVTVTIRDVAKHPFQPSTGEIEETTNNTPGTLDIPPFTPTGTAQSFFDVFFEIDVPSLGLHLHNDVPKRMETTITHKPPGEGDTYEGLTTIPLLDPNENPTGVTIGSVRHTPNPRECGDTFTSQCDGACPNPDDVCTNTGTLCECLPSFAPCDCGAPCLLICADGTQVEGLCVVESLSFPGQCLCTGICPNEPPLCPPVCTNEPCQLSCPTGGFAQGQCEVPDPQGCLCTNLGVEPCP